MDKNMYKTPVVKVFITDDGIQYFFGVVFVVDFIIMGYLV